MKSTTTTCYCISTAAADPTAQQLILSRHLKCPIRKRLYARYPFDQLENACQNVDDPSIIKDVYEFRRIIKEQGDALSQNKRKKSE